MRYQELGEQRSGQSKEQKKPAFSTGGAHTLVLSEFNVTVMTGNNGALHRFPYDPGIQNDLSFLSSMELLI